MRSAAFYSGLFAWAPFAAILMAATHVYGLPHVIWAYEWRELGADRIYTRCTHAGPYGVFDVPASNGRCAWLVFRTNHSRRTLQ